jgi:hydrogenase expression/formation protein HypD
MNRSFTFSEPKRARALADAIAILAPSEPTKLVHVCGTHEITITRHGLRRFLPETVQIFEGPGCPVCVTPTRDIDAAVQIAKSGAILFTFGDMARIPGTRKTLEETRAGGADVRVILSAADAVRIARETDREAVFFAVGFETTAPSTAAILLDDPPENFSVLVSHKLIPPAMAALLDLPGTDINGYIAPGHVSTIIGTRPYEQFPENYQLPVVVSGFEPLDVLYSVALLLRQLRDRTSKVENAYPRAVKTKGNTQAQRLIDEVFEVADTLWRGIGIIPASGLHLRKSFEHLDARTRFVIDEMDGEDVVPGCRCADVLTARAVPDECPLFAKRCTPLSPIGPCMVGTEGACNIWFRYGGRPRL